MKEKIVLSQLIAEKITEAQQANSQITFKHMGIKFIVLPNSDPIILQLDWQLAMCQGDKKVIGPSLTDQPGADKIRRYSKLLSKIFSSSKAKVI